MATTITEQAPTRRTSRGTAAHTDVRTHQNPRRRLTLRRAGLGRTGSKQIVSVRGRRLTNTTEDRRIFRLIVVGVAAVIAVVGIAMYLSAASASRSLELDVAKQKETNLRNSIEVLERDVAYLDSTGAIVKEARGKNLHANGQPQVLAVGADGALNEVRPAGDNLNREVADLNGGAATNPHQPTANPDETANVPGMQAPVVQEATPGSQRLPATAPYAPHSDAPAPAPAPAPNAGENMPAPTPVPVPAPVPAPAAPVAH